MCIFVETEELCIHASLLTSLLNLCHGPGSKIYRDRFQTPKHFAAVDRIRTVLARTEGPSISMTEASLRWIRHHSLLGDKDGIIIGASKISHFDANMSSLLQGPLPAHVVQAFDDAAAIANDVCPSYERGYSGSNTRT